MGLGMSDVSMDIRSVAVLTIISIASAASLGLIHNITEDRIAKAEEQQVQNALSKVFPQADNPDPLDNQIYRAVEDGGTIGYAGVAKGRGYGGFIKLAVGVDMNGDIARVRIIKQSETPGLGSRITEKDFLSQFGGISISGEMSDLELTKNNGEIDALTGATISSQAVVDIVRDKVKELRDYLEG